MRIMDWSSDVCSSDLDAPPEHEDCRPFLHVTGLLQQAGLNVPAILAQNTQEGFLLLSDLGRHTYYQAIQAGLDDDSLQKIYRDALAELVDRKSVVSGKSVSGSVDSGGRRFIKK